MKRFQISAVTLTLTLFGIAGAGRADLVLSAPTLSVSPGSSGAFDLLITNTNPTGGASYFLAADTLELLQTGASGINFTEVNTATAIPYVFTVPGVDNGGGPFSFDTFPTSGFDASDSEFGGLGFDEIAPGAVFGIAHVLYSVDVGAILGSRDLTFGPGTSLSDTNGDPVGVTFLNGALNVSAVPEPSTLVLLALGIFGGTGVRWLRSLSRVLAPTTSDGTSLQ
jgi:hypothetical protein